MPSRRLLTIGAVAVAGVVLIGALVRLADRGASPTAQVVAQAPPSHRASPPGSQPSDEATPFGVAPTDTPTPTPAPSATPSPTPPPTAPPTPTLTPVAILSHQVQNGQATVSAMTAPRTTCTIAVGYTPPPRGLGPATSTGSGTVTWTWFVARQVQAGTYQIVVTCGSGSAVATITVS